MVVHATIETIAWRCGSIDNSVCNRDSCERVCPAKYYHQFMPPSSSSHIAVFRIEGYPRVPLKLKAHFHIYVTKTQWRTYVFILFTWLIKYLSAPILPFKSVWEPTLWSLRTNEDCFFRFSAIFQLNKVWNSWSIVCNYTCLSKWKWDVLAMYYLKSLRVTLTFFWGVLGGGGVGFYLTFNSKTLFYFK